MPLSTNPFVGLDLEWLLAEQTTFKTAIVEIATTGQLYITDSGRRFVAADLEKMKETLFEINQAIAKAQGKGAIRIAYPRMY